MYTIRVREKWKPITGFGLRREYEVSNYAQVRRVDTGRIMKSTKNKDGYSKFGLATHEGCKSKTLLAHRLVAIYFLPNPENKPQVNHRNPSRPFNNSVLNLQWVTDIENKEHAMALKLLRTPTGADRYNNRFSESLVHAICKLMELEYSNTWIRRKLKLFDDDRSVNAAYNNLLTVLRRKVQWKSITSLYNY